MKAQNVNKQWSLVQNYLWAEKFGGIMTRSQPKPLLPFIVATGIVILSAWSYWLCRKPLHPQSPPWWLLTSSDTAHSVKETGEAAGTMKSVPLLLGYREVGSFIGQFQSLMAIAVDSKGYIYGADCELNTVRKYSPEGKLVLSFGSKGTAVGLFNEPRGIAIDERDFVYVMDTWNGRVQKFTGDGQFVATFGAEQGLFGPRALAVSNGLVYVVDSGGGRIVVYTTEGAFLRTFASKGRKPGELVEPVGIALTSMGEVYVLDSANDRIQKFSAVGAALSILHVPGWTTKALKEAHLATSPDEGLFVIDPIFGTVVLFGHDGSIIGRLGDRLDAPSAIATRESKIFVGERRSGVIRTFVASE